MNLRRLAIVSLTAMNATLAHVGVVRAQDNNPSDAIVISTGEQFTQLCAISGYSRYTGKDQVLLAIKSLCKRDDPKYLESVKTANDGYSEQVKVGHAQYERQLKADRDEYQTRLDTNRQQYVASGSTGAAYSWKDKQDTEAWKTKDKQETEAWKKKDLAEVTAWGALVQSKFPKGLLLSLKRPDGPQ